MQKLKLINRVNLSHWNKQPPFKLSYYKDLTKAKLSMFVLLTTMAGYTLAPFGGTLNGLILTTLGTGLSVSSANSINQWTERPLDAQMTRTRNRVLVTHRMSPHHAFAVGTLSGLAGAGILYFTVNPLAAALGFGNILLYTAVYTPMKRLSIFNTWPGALVGAIPPVIGWVACTGSIDLGFVLFAWQFPHFNALSWSLRPDYAKAGYKMMSVLNPELNARVSLRYSMLLFPASIGFWWIGTCTPWFLLDSSLINGYMLYYAFKFWRNSNDENAKKLFFSSLVHLPIILILLMLHKAPIDLENYTEQAIEEEKQVEKFFSRAKKYLEF